MGSDMRMAVTIVTILQATLEKGSLCGRNLVPVQYRRRSNKEHFDIFLLMQTIGM